jgi:hypothetical protein
MHWDCISGIRNLGTVILYQVGCNDPTLKVMVLCPLLIILQFLSLYLGPNHALHPLENVQLFKIIRIAAEAEFNRNICKFPEIFHPLILSAWK